MTIQYEIKEYVGQNINGDEKAVYAENKNGKKDGYVQNNNKKRKLTRKELENMLKIKQDNNINPLKGHTLLDLMNKHLVKPKPILYKNAIQTVIPPNKSIRKTRHKRKRPKRKANKTKVAARRRKQTKSNKNT